MLPHQPMRIVLALAAIALASCGQSSQTGYPPGYEMNFMRACEAQSTVPGLCACTWDKIEAGVSPSDFAAYELLPGTERVSHPLTEQLQGYALTCATELGVELPTAP